MYISTARPATAIEGAAFFIAVTATPTRYAVAAAATTLVSFRSEFVAQPKPAFGYGLVAFGTRYISGTKPANEIDGPIFRVG